MENEETALKALEAAPEDPPLLERRIRVERAKAHRSLMVRAVGSAALVLEEVGEGERWVVKGKEEGEEKVDIKAMLEEYGEVEEISLKVGGWEGEDERGLDVRFAHRDDCISALNGLKHLHAELEITWSHDAKNRFNPFPTTPNPNPLFQATPPPHLHQVNIHPHAFSGSPASPSPSRPYGYRGGRGGYRGSSFRGRGSGFMGGRGGGFHNRAGSNPFASPRGREVGGGEREKTEKDLKEEMGKMRRKEDGKGEGDGEQEVEGLKAEEWPALPRVKTPTRLHWDKETSEPAVAAPVTPPSELSTTSITISEAPTSAPTVPDSHKTPPARHPAPLEPDESPSYSATLASPSALVLNPSIPSVPARVISQTAPLQKSSSLPPTLPSSNDETTTAINIDTSTFLTTPRSSADPLQILLRRTTTTPPDSSNPGPPAYQTPVANNTNGGDESQRVEENTPGLSLGEGSPSSPLVGTPLSGGVGLGVSERREGTGMVTGSKLWQANEKETVLVDPQAVFVGGLNKIEMDDVKLRGVFEPYGRIIDFHFVRE
ncbi:hypothetical protein BDY24DRAFT_94720 [Mrakia frigida]|uniref:uncharacterized protein n=1 Tax=Mrakia frigida TaxID=29902 RepID=UPI003FCBFEE7